MYMKCITNLILDLAQQTCHCVVLAKMTQECNPPITQLS
jgi:hypothetical protein